MKNMSLIESIKHDLGPCAKSLGVRIFVTRDDGITIYDSIQNKTTNSVSALVSGLWQASEALMNLVHQDQQVLEYRLGFDNSSNGLFLFPFTLSDKKYFLGCIYQDSLNPAQLKYQMNQIKKNLEKKFNLEKKEQIKSTVSRQGYLFSDITDAEMDRLFALGGI
jgi:hypothetical protein